MGEVDVIRKEWKGRLCTCLNPTIKFTVEHKKGCKCLNEMSSTNEMVIWHSCIHFWSNFKDEPEGDLPLMYPIEVKQECIEKTFKESEILKLLQNLDVNKSCGPDGLHPKMLKELSATISKPITTIFNSSMCQGLVPQLWKEGKSLHYSKRRSGRTRKL